MVLKSKEFWEGSVTVKINNPDKHRAMLINDGTKDAWIPYSQIESPVDYEKLESGEVIELLIPQWLAEEKGLA